MIIPHQELNLIDVVSNNESASIFGNGSDLLKTRCQKDAERKSKLRLKKRDAAAKTDGRRINNIDVNPINSMVTADNIQVNDAFTVKKLLKRQMGEES